jgi:protein arginine N-methyltransferase 5
VFLVFVEDGISIPCSYTSYVAPISSSKVWNEVKLHDTLKSFETPYVVRLHNFFSIAESQPCFRFDHPKFHPSQHEEKKKNRRYTKLSFVAKETSIIHGFGGYFDTVLFGDVMLSINPATHSEGMFSWFPIFFPLRQPTRIQRGQKLDVFFWRMVNEQKVWYEWTLKIENQTIAPIHNPNGRSYWIGL